MRLSTKARQRLNAMNPKNTVSFDETTREAGWE
jgi:hypothetical protein